jgi:TolB protein
VPATGDPELVVTSSRDGDTELYLRAADGTLTQLTRNTAGDYGGVWSPDGRRLAFVSDRDGGEPEIYRMNADGSGQVRLTRTAAFVSDHTPSWSPDGAYVVFASFRAGQDNVEVYRMRPDGSQVTRLTTTAAGVDDNAPQYSPDGRSIAFSSTRAGNQQGVWLMDADGGNPRRLVDDPARDDVFPRWTADGRVVYAHFGTEQRGSDVWITAADGTGARELLAPGSAEHFADPRPPIR